MIRTEQLSEWLQEELPARGLFLVDASVKPGNRIIVHIDSMEGVTVDSCIAVSRFLESKLDRNAEDFELEVSSPGLDNPLKLPVQFKKNEGRLLHVVMPNGQKITGKLLASTETGFSIELEKIIRDKQTKKKIRVTETPEFRYEDIKAAIVAINIK